MKNTIQSKILTTSVPNKNPTSQNKASRFILTLLHRWAGLVLAVFLFIAGLTGTIISWDHELDEWLNPHLFERQSQGDPLSPLDLADRLEASDPRLRVTSLSLELEPGYNLVLGVDARINPDTAKPYDLGFDQIALDPVSGEIRGARMWGEISFSRENLLPFLYKLHYSMHIPDVFDLKFGMLFMGILAIVWTIDCFIALWISFPNLKSWYKSLTFRWRQGSFKLTFDLHRSGGVWVWGALLIIAVSSVSMNLYDEVMRPIVSAFSPLNPDPFVLRTPSSHDQSIEPLIDRRQIIEIASQEVKTRGWETPMGRIFYEPDYGIYGVTLHGPGKNHADFGLGNPWLYYDGQNGTYLGDRIPGSGSFGDIFLEAQFPLHSGRILGLPGRIMVSILGLVVAMLSLTGIMIWIRKRSVRAKILNSKLQQ